MCSIHRVSIGFLLWLTHLTVDLVSAISAFHLCLSSELRRYCLETRYLAPRIATALLLHSLNFMKLVGVFLIKSWNFVSLVVTRAPSLECNDLALERWLPVLNFPLMSGAGLVVGRVGAQGQWVMVVPVFRCSSSPLPHWEGMTQRKGRAIWMCASWSEYMSSTSMSLQPGMDCSLLVWVSVCPNCQCLVGTEPSGGLKTPGTQGKPKSRMITN